MRANTSAVMLLLLLLLLTDVGPQMASSAALASPRQVGRARSPLTGGGVQRINRGFRLGGADRFSHGFGRRRRVDDVRVDPLL